MDEKTSFIMYTRYAAFFDVLNGSDVKRLMSAIFTYVEHGKAPNFDNNEGLSVAFASVRADLDRNLAKWKEEKTKRSEAGKKGATARWNSE